MKSASPLTLLAGLAIACAGCSSAPSSTTTSTYAAANLPAASSCVFESRRVPGCGGPEPQTAWVPQCNAGACPAWFDDHIVTSEDPIGGGTCSSVDEYRHVTDFAGTCDDWAAQGQPITPF
jgi:hypothetical protein